MVFVFSEHVLATIKREFIEEAMNSNFDAAKQIDQLFKNGNSVNKFELFEISCIALNRFIKVILMIQEIQVRIYYIKQKELLYFVYSR
jgi:hypothetical protein